MSIKRINADILELTSPEYAANRIFYTASESNVRHGTACVFGPIGTPYEDCPMLYAFQIPEGFPFDNPKVTFHTHDGRTRFHPNMYVEGKVCLSILGTWAGPSWASTMRLSTVLITLQSLMDNKPLMHEPGYASGSGDVHYQYADCVEHACMHYIVRLAKAVSGVKGATYPELFLPFVEEFKKQLPDILKRLEARLKARLSALNQKERTFMSNLPYSMGGTTTYKALLNDVVKLNANEFISKQ
jgi:ubiquitin-protein ligase